MTMFWICKLNCIFSVSLIDPILGYKNKSKTIETEAIVRLEFNFFHFLGSPTLIHNIDEGKNKRLERAQQIIKEEIIGLT